MPSAMRPVIDEIVQAIQDRDLARFRALCLQAFDAVQATASPEELTAVIEDLAPILGTVTGVATKLALLAGACVESGGSPLPLVEVLPRRAYSAMWGHDLFPDVWRNASGGQPLPTGRSNTEVTEILVAYAERRGLPTAKYSTIATSWFDVADWIKLMLACMGRREFRAALDPRDRGEIRDAATAIAKKDVANAEWLKGLALVLDDEPVIVLDPPSGRGFRLTMSGIGDNFQLHTLLADRLSGPGERGVPGLEPPVEAWVEEASTKRPVMHPGTDPIVRRFRLYDGNGDYVYPEGRPADIGVTGGTRVLVLYPPNGNFGWSCARAYPFMTPTLTLDAVLSSAEAAEWLGRAAPARESDMMARRRP